MTKTAWLVTCALVGGMSVGGCGGGSASGGAARAPDSSAVADRYGYDVTTATMTPVYALIPEYNDRRDGYARDLLARQCLAGVVDYEPVHLGEQADYFDERTGQPVFDAEVAAEWGYSGVRLHPTSDGAVPDNVTITPAMNATMQQCGHAADARLGTPPQRLPAEIEAAGWDAVGVSDDVADAASTWRDCMQPAGVIDLPDTPDEMPSPSVVTPGSETATPTGDLEQDSSVPPSAREIQVAMLDAQCRDQSGFTRNELEARATAELDVIGRNLDGFDAVRLQYRTYEEGVDRVIAELG